MRLEAQFELVRQLSAGSGREVQDAVTQLQRAAGTTYANANRQCWSALEHSMLQALPGFLDHLLRRTIDTTASTQHLLAAVYLMDFVNMVELAPQHAGRCLTPL